MSVRLAARGLLVLASTLLAAQAGAADDGWLGTATSGRCLVGARRTFVCPPRGTRGTVWGDGPYTDDSSVCTAAVHAGVITLERGGEVTIEIRAGAASYGAGSAGGVTTLRYGAWSCSFDVIRPASRATSAPAFTPTPAPAPMSSSAASEPAPAATVIVTTPYTPVAEAPRDDRDPLDEPPPPRSTPREVAGVGLGMDLLRATGSGDALRTTADGMFALRTTMHGRAGRRVAIVLGMEEGFGTDPSGYRRYDLAWSLPEMYFYLTPDAAIQLYTLTGFELRLSHFESAPGRALPGDAPWTSTYLGAVLGTGFETRVAEKTSLRFELRGFLRGRADGSSGSDPFYAATSTSRGVSLGVGMVFF